MKFCFLLVFFLLLSGHIQSEVQQQTKSKKDKGVYIHPPSIPWPPIQERSKLKLPQIGNPWDGYDGTSSHIETYSITYSSSFCQMAYEFGEYLTMKMYSDYISSGNTNYGMKEKAKEAHLALENRLKDVMKEMSKDLDDEARRLLDSHQKEWMKYAQTKCEFMSDAYRGGSHESLSFSMNYIKLLLNRIKELKTMREERGPK